ncbi:MAG TPA: EamA family transporter [Lacipirellulaceae bacterium]|jgi:drug/metabolite transporter (DMT)-like permease|nr:EamA family transporter [Lacipirellulaceae bacterium]
MSDSAGEETFLAEQPVPSEVAVGDIIAARVPTVAAARIYVLISAVLWSTSGFFVKSPYLVGWTGPRIAFWRAVFACVALWPLVRRPSWSLRLVPMTILFVGMNYTYLTAMAKGSAANAIWLQCTAPVWVLLVGVFVFGEKAVWRDWLMVACATLGIGVIIFFEMRGASLEAVLWALASSFFYAGVVLSLRQLRGYDSVWLAALNHLVTVIALAPFAFGGVALPSGVQWGVLAAFGIFQMGLPYALFAYSLKRIPGHEATAIGLVEPLLNPLWVFLAWGNRPAWWTVAGGSLILVGLAIRFLWRPRAKQHK